MLGFDSVEGAKEAYIKQYDNPKFYGGCTTLTVDRFKKEVFGTHNNPHMIKSMVWTVSGSPMGKFPDEEQFGQWIHSYPVHEHELHWQGLQQHHQKVQSEQEAQRQQELRRPQGLGDKMVDPAELGALQ